MRRIKGRPSSRLPGMAAALIAAGALLSAASPYAPSSLNNAAYLATANSQPAPQGLQSSIAEAAPLATNSSNSVYFRETAHFLKDAFLNYWLMNGGVSLYGYPITEEFTLNGVPTQYFERSRFEYRAGSARPWKVDLAGVGSMLTVGRDFPRVTLTSSTPDLTYFEQTGHTLSGAFRQFWQAKGGIDIFGYPISEEKWERGRIVQYFEKARFELAGPGRIQLGRLGNELLEKQPSLGELTLGEGVATPLARPGYSMSFSGEATWFRANWDRVISLNKGWGNLPRNFVGQGLYAAAPADLGLYGRWARVTRGNRSIYVQFVDVINWPDLPYVRSRGIVIDLGEESYRALGQDRGGRYEVSFDVFWPGEGPDNRNALFPQP